VQWPIGKRALDECFVSGCRYQKEMKTQPKALEMLFGLVTDLFVDRHKFKGHSVRAVCCGSWSPAVCCFGQGLCCAGATHDPPLDGPPPVVRFRHGCGVFHGAAHSCVTAVSVLFVHRVCASYSTRLGNYVCNDREITAERQDFGNAALA
jgi:hypothetical protein